MSEHFDGHFLGPKSKELFERAQNVIPGGVNSPVRAFGHVGGTPIFFERGEGAYVFDVDGNKYIDYVGSWGPLIFGHAPSFVTEILTSVAKKGTSFGAPTEIEVQFAEKICAMIPALEMVRCVSSGTEATMSAIRIARAYTGRKKLVKFNGCYHGHADSLLVKAGSGVATLGIPGSPGVPEEIASMTTSIEYNDLGLLEETVSQLGPDQISAIIIEPVAGNMGLILPEPGYLEGIRKLCDKHGIVFIIDEVMTGFRVALGGAHSRYNVKPDILCFGKVIGGGLPVGAFGGKREIMQKLAPLGPVYQAGTLSGNPLALSVGIEMLDRLQKQNPYPELEKVGEQFAEGMIAIGNKVGIPISAQSCGSMIGFFFSEKLPKNYTEVSQGNIPLFKKFFHQMLRNGVYLAPSAYEAGFISVCHDEQIVAETLQRAEKSLKETS
jgi:glutamate-1-semialdehyde 2,1-aminomutase